MAPPFGNDLYPALEQLARFFEPYAKALTLAGVLFSPFPHSVPGWVAAYPVAQPLLAAIAAYLSGFLKLPEIDFKKPELAQLTQPWLAFQTVSKSVGPYFNAALLIFLACYIPISQDLPLPFQPWLHILLLGIAIAAGFLAPTTKFAGPFRYGYLNYSQHFTQFYNLLASNWWIITTLSLFPSPVLLPLFSLGLAATSLAAWAHVHREYSDELRTITDTVSRHAGRGGIAVCSARGYAAAAARCEAELVSAAAGTRRDALLATSVRSTDFFHCASDAWSALGTVTQPAVDARSHAKELAEAAYDADEADKPGEMGDIEDDDGGEDEDSDENKEEDDDDDGDDNEPPKGPLGVMAQYLHEKAMEALDSATKFEAKLKIAQEAVRQSTGAREQDEKARQQARTNAAVAAVAARVLSRTVSQVPETSRTVEQSAENAKQFAALAVTVAIEGDMTSAKGAVDSAKREADKAEEAAETLRKIQESAHEVLLQWLEKDS